MSLSDLGHQTGSTFNIKVELNKKLIMALIDSCRIHRFIDHGLVKEAKLPLVPMNPTLVTTPDGRRLKHHMLPVTLTVIALGDNAVGNAKLRPSMRWGQVSKHN